MCGVQYILHKYRPKYTHHVSRDENICSMSNRFANTPGVLKTVLPEDGYHHSSKMAVMHTAFILLSVSVAALSSQISHRAWMNVSDKPEVRASRLLRLMNVSEKVRLLHGSHSEDKVRTILQLIFECCRHSRLLIDRNNHVYFVKMPEFYS